jgi:hypothetical protein
MKRFILVRQGQKTDKFPDVVIHDTSELVPAVIDGRQTRIYKPISVSMNYLDAYPIMKKMNEDYNADSNL